MRTSATRGSARTILGAVTSALLLASAAAQPLTGSDQPTDAGRFDVVTEEIARGHKSVRAVAVSRSDLPIFEYYRGGIDPDDRADVQSVTKSVTSILVGIALGEGKLKSLDQQISDFLPEVLAPGVDPRARGITIRHLLTMTSGFEPASPAHLLASPPPQSALWLWPLYRPMLASPGEIASYDNESPHLLSLLLTRATQQSSADYAHRNLFEPLGIANAVWLRDGEGNAHGGYGLSATARDMLKIGSLYVRKGKWGSRQIVPEWFVRESVTPHQTINNEAYGYLWWIPKPSRELGPYAAVGYGGQVIFVAPALDVVIAIQSDTPGSMDNARNLVGVILGSIRGLTP